MTSSPRRPRRLLALIGAALLAACAAQPPSPAPPDGDRAAPAADRWQRLPATTLRESPLAALFAPAMAALDAGDWMRAEVALPEPVGAQPPSPDYRAYSALVRARIAYLRGDRAALQAALAGAPRRGVSADLRARLLTLERRQARQRGDYLAGAEAGLRLRELLRGDAAAVGDLDAGIWLDLQHLTARDLAAARTGAGPALAGWLDWLRVARGELTAARWGLRHAPHPARAMPRPTDDAGRRHVALLLPLSGRLAAAGSAVRDGFLAAHYAAPDPSATRLSVIDSTRYDSPAAAYREAVAGGAELIVGPLSKDAVAAVLAQSDLPVPVLALNRSGAVPARALQFALAPEDEARQLARRALGAGYRRALLLRPAGAWGDKLAGALSAAWTAGGGRVAAEGVFSSREDHSETIETALALDASRERGQALRRRLGSPLVLAGRRRQDIDVVFMLAPSTETAKSLKPLLAYHYAGDLPVFATSAANSAGVQTADRDLDGLRLLELPWLLGEAPALRRALAETELPGTGLARLQALGVDAHLLVRRHAALQPGGALLLRGATGDLTVHDDRTVVRELPLAVFDRGGPRRLSLD